MTYGGCPHVVLSHWLIGKLLSAASNMFCPLRTVPVSQLKSLGWIWIPGSWSSCRTCSCCARNRSCWAAGYVRTWHSRIRWPAQKCAIPAIKGRHYVDNFPAFGRFLSQLGCKCFRARVIGVERDIFVLTFRLVASMNQISQPKYQPSIWTLCA